MHISSKISVNAPKQDVWRVITDIENATNTISAIENIEILNKPSDGIVGLKWSETRIMFGKSATETMWITDAVEDDFYATEAQSHGAVYRSKMYVADQDGATELGFEFNAEPQTFGAKFLSATMGFLFKGATEKAMHQDLVDIKAKVESAQT